MNKIYQFKKVVTYEVEADSYEHAVRMRNDLDDAIYKDGVVDNIYEEESIESGKWVFTNEVPVSEIEETILKVCKFNGIVDDKGDIYGLTDKGRAYLDSLNGESDYDVNDYDEAGNLIDDDCDIEDEFYDYITN